MCFFKSISLQFFVSFVALVIASQSALFSADKNPGGIDFTRDIRPLLSDNCFSCHGPDLKQLKADLRLDTRDGAISDLGGYSAVVPGKPSESELVIRILTDDDDDLMPPSDSGKKLTSHQKALLQQWIAEGAEYDMHWAYKPVKRVAPPKVKNESFVINDIDRFLLQKIEKSGFSPSNMADRVTLARRLYYDLLGMPPLPEEIESFVIDKSAGAYEKFIEQLLNDPRYGERMAVHWLDLVRYADTIGYHSDAVREVSAYRDYVIDSFNNNKPYDQFTIEQLAGDLLGEPSISQRIASGYNRLLQTTEEGGAQAKEYRAIYAADRVRNVSGVWLGSTLGCAQCHDHKYDPFSTRDFYSMAAFFADIKETAVGRQNPNFKIPTDTQSSEIISLREQIRDGDFVELDALHGFARTFRTTNGLDLNGNFIYALNIGGDSSVQIGNVEFKPANQGVDGFTGDLNSGAGDAGQHSEEELKKLLSTHGWSNDPVSMVLNVKSGNRYKLQLIIREPKGREHYRNFSVNINGRAVVDNLLVNVRGSAYEKESLVYTVEVDAFNDTMKIALIPGNIIGSTDGVPIINALTLEDVSDQPNLIKPKYFSAFAEGQVKWESEIMAKLKKKEDAKLPNNVIEAIKVSPVKRSAAQRATLLTYYFSVASATAEMRERVGKLRKSLANTEKSIKTMLVTETEKPRMTRILPRGDWLDESGEEVLPAVPEFLPKNKLRNDGKRANRLDLANWIVDAKNPLTARAYVNRMWKLFFGKGLSSRLDDLGGQGEPPSHPELLDWLAIEFVENDWDMKHIVRLLVSSAAYRQTSVSSVKLDEVDAGNRMYARQSRFRVDAEMVRDAALRISGLLIVQNGGYSAKPYQPVGYWKHLNFPKRKWNHDKGENQYRRGLYTFWCRTFLHPSMLAFDAPSREECSAERTRSNTPQQALVLLNDPTYVEASRVFAEQILQNGGSSDEARLEWAFSRALSRKPLDQERVILLDLLKSQLKRYEVNIEEAKQAASAGQWPVAKALKPESVAAWSSVSRAIMNLYETTSRF